MRGEKRKPTNKSFDKEIGHKTQLYMERPKRGKKRKKKDTISSDRVEIITKNGSQLMSTKHRKFINWKVESQSPDQIT